MREEGRTMGFFSSFRSEMNEDWSYEVAGRQVTCSHCGGTEFEESHAQPNTAGLTFLDLDWANRSATIYICKHCGHIEWFLQA